MRLYPQKAGVFPGEILKLCISTDHDGDSFHIDFYRQSTALVWVGRLANQTGNHADDGSADEDWQWPEHLFQIPQQWASGAYVAVLLRGSGTENPPRPEPLVHGDVRHSRALFVVKSANPGADTCVLLKIALNTYQAYNFTGGNSLYVATSTVSMRRPGGGLGGLTTFTPDTGGCCGDDDIYDPATLRQTFGHWEAHFIEWLEAAGIRVDYCTDVDVHCDVSGSLLQNYQLVLCVGHDEYWSQEMRDRLTAFRDRGGNIAIFSGNTCYRKVEFHDEAGQQTSDADYIVTMFRPGNWRGEGSPENELTGTSYDNAGGWWSRKRVNTNPPTFISNCDSQGFCDSSRDAVGFTVEQGAHWIFSGTGLKNGDVFGQNEYLVGYECDGAVFERVSGQPIPTGIDGTPLNSQILATAQLRFDDSSFSPGWMDVATGNRVATMVIYTAAGGGTVFNASTTDWARVVHNNPTVDTITRNVMQHLSTISVRILGPMPQHCGRYVAAVCPASGSCPTVRFKIDPAVLPKLAGYHFQWAISEGSGQSLDQPWFEATMPSQPIPVTVTVHGDNGTNCPVFGTLTFTPLTTEQFERLEILCQLRKLGMMGHPPLRSIEGVGEKARRMLVDPLWDPLRDGLSLMFTQRDFQEMMRGAERIAALAKRLSDRFGH